MNGAGARASRVAVVTPYWREPGEVLAKCMASVRRQTHPVTHILVADGVPQELPETAGVIHVRLPVNVGNSGATPRGIGAQLAFNLGYDAVAFLDADNWYEPDHIERAMRRLDQGDVDVVFARRRIVFPDDAVMQAEDPQDSSGDHVDTNCYVISRRAAFLAGIWLMWPREFGTGEDRMLLATIRHTGLRTAMLDTPTVWYRTNWGIHYRVEGKAPVAPLRQPARKFITHFEPVRFRQMTGMRTSLPAAPQAAPPPRRPGEHPCIGVILDGDGPDQPLPDWARAEGLGGRDIRCFVVGTGEPPEDRRVAGVRYLTLPWHPGFGNTARGVGAALAFQTGCDAVLILPRQGGRNPARTAALVRRLGESQDDFLVDPGAAANAAAGPGTADGDEARAPFAAQAIPATAAHLGPLWAQLPPELAPAFVLPVYLRLAQARGCRGAAIAPKPDPGMAPASVQGMTLPAAVIFQRTGIRRERPRRADQTG